MVPSSVELMARLGSQKRFFFKIKDTFFASVGFSAEYDKVPVRFVALLSLRCARAWILRVVITETSIWLFQCITAQLRTVRGKTNRTAADVPLLSLLLNTATPDIVKLSDTQQLQRNCLMQFGPYSL